MAHAPDAEPRPFRAYYRSMRGRWTGTFAFALTDPAALGASDLSWVERSQVRWMAAVQRVIGPFRIDTTVDDAQPAEVVHTTRVSKWGLTLFVGLERFVPEPNGRDGRVLGGWSARPRWPWQRDQGYGDDARVRVDEDALGATYRMRALGDLVQVARVNPAGLSLVQRTGWSRADVQLMRVDG
ncbi:MAG: hypothetical protein ABMB14_39995 [Myxococcota bacterium]